MASCNFFRLIILLPARCDVLEVGGLPTSTSEIVLLVRCSELVGGYWLCKLWSSVGVALVTTRMNILKYI